MNQCFCYSSDNFTVTLFLLVQHPDWHPKHCQTPRMLLKGQLSQQQILVFHRAALHHFGSRWPLIPLCSLPSPLGSSSQVRETVETHNLYPVCKWLWLYSFFITRFFDCQWTKWHWGKLVFSYHQFWFNFILNVHILTSLKLLFFFLIFFLNGLTQHKKFDLSWLPDVNEACPV